MITFALPGTLAWRAQYRPRTRTGTHPRHCSCDKQSHSAHLPQSIPLNHETLESKDAFADKRLDMGLSVNVKINHACKKDP